MYHHEHLPVKDALVRGTTLSLVAALFNRDNIGSFSYTGMMGNEK